MQGDDLMMSRLWKDHLVWISDPGGPRYMEAPEWEGPLRNCGQGAPGDPDGDAVTLAVILREDVGDTVADSEMVRLSVAVMEAVSVVVSEAEGEAENDVDSLRVLVTVLDVVRDTLVLRVLDTEPLSEIVGVVVADRDSLAEGEDATVAVMEMEGVSDWL